MKSQLRALALVAIIGLLSSCAKKETLPIPNSPDEQGRWKLEKVHGGLMGVNANFQSGEVSWTFDPSTQTLTVQNNVTQGHPNHMHAGLATGSYPYSLQASGGLSINGQSQGEVSFQNGKLLLDEGLAVDGFVRTFSK